MQCLNCSAIHLEEVLLCKTCRLPLWNLVAAVQKCGECGKRWSMHASSCSNCLMAAPRFEPITVTVIEEPKIEPILVTVVEPEAATQVKIEAKPKQNKEISASTIFVKSEAEKRIAKNTNRRVKFIIWFLLISIVVCAAASAVIWLYDPYYFYETYFSIRTRLFGGG
jgi:hypothetical protein